MESEKTATGQAVDVGRLNRKERRKIMKGGTMGYMIPGRNMPFVKKSYGAISNFYGLRTKEIEEENRLRQAAQLKNAAAIGSSAHFTTTAMPEKVLEYKATH